MWSRQRSPGLLVPRSRVDSGEIQHLDSRDLSDERGQSRHTRSLGGRVAGIDDRQPQVDRSHREVMAHIAGHETLGTFLRCRLDERRPRSGDDGEGLHNHFAISGDTDSRWAELVDNRCLDRVQRAVEATHPPYRREVGIGVFSERLHLPETEESGQRVCGATRGRIEVGVRHQEVDPGSNQSI
jgi:hypothetical protein